MVNKHKGRTSTIAEVWEFLHAFVVEAARAGSDLEEDGTFVLEGAAVGIDVPGLLFELHIREAGSNKGLLYDRLAHSLGITWLQVESIVRGWEGFSWEDTTATLGAWPRLGRQLRYAYLHARSAPDAVCDVPWPWRLPNPCWSKSGAASVLWLTVQVAFGTPSLSTSRAGGQYRWYNSLTRAEGTEPTEYFTRLAAETNLAEYVAVLQGVLQCNKPTWR